MAERILGPTGSPRRRRWLGVPVLLVALVALFWIAGAQAVHDEGVFELEGNATIGVDANNPANPQAQPPGGDDAENVFLDNDSADESTFIEDTTLSGGLAGAGDTILTGGGTKDINDFVPGPWLWKETAQTSVQDKDDIEHAFAAQYTVDKSGAGESCGSAGQVADCELLYFGADRFSNSGDSVLGFWFLKGNVQAVGPDAQGNGTFTGSHTARNGSVRGDILIVTDFRQGGKAPSIQVYEWVNSGGSASTHLDLVGGGPNPAGCTQSPPEKNNQPPVPPVAAGDNFCATANQAIITSPWEYEAKSNSGGTSGDGGTDTKYGIATYMEGGINLTALGFGDQCFNTFLAETRASHSVTATLSDFVIGGFGACTSGITTTPQSQTAAGPPPVFSNITTALSIGANARVTVRDNAVINVTGTDTFGGTVKFFLCGPLPLNDNTNCSTGGVQIGASAGETVTGASGTATVPSASAVLTSAGDYCWRAEYSGDSQKGVPASSDPSKSVADGGTRSECFQIDPLQPTLTTTGGPDVTLGNAITDTASLTGTAKQPGTDGVGPNGTINATAGSQANAGGTITWTLRGPDDCDDAGLTISGTNPVTVNGDNTSYGPVSATPTALGKYTWVATYSGNTPNTLGAAGSCPPAAGDGDEEIIVSGVATLQTRQRWLPNDAAQITSPAGSTLAGDVVFTLYNDGECGEDGGTAQYTKTVDVTTGTGSANSRNVTTDNTTFHVTANNDGTAWSWKVTYDDDALGDPDPTCETTTPAFTLTD